MPHALFCFLLDFSQSAFHHGLGRRGKRDEVIGIAKIAALRMWVLSKLVTSSMDSLLSDVQASWVAWLKTDQFASSNFQRGVRVGTVTGGFSRFRMIGK
uniref:Putative secreted protein n=1 Tax=Ixodes ricinus TaxID=34613 RepID=A0A6B0U5K7_IXORI